MVSIVLLVLLSIVIVIISQGPRGWRLEKRVRSVANLTSPDDPLRMTYQEYGEQRLTFYQAFPGPPDAFALKAAIFSSYWAIMKDQQYLDDYAYLNYSRWTIFALFLGFLMPLFTLAYGTGALGAERESRTMIWLTTRPLPRWAIYLAKLLGVLPWSLAVCSLAFVMLGLAGGENGRKALTMYWPPVIAGTITFTALFHMIGALLRRPAVISLVYVYFFDSLVANLPGSLKQLSLGFYVRSLFYDCIQTGIPTVRPDSVSVYAPADPLTCWVTLLGVTLAVTMFGMIQYGRQETREET
jgi:ABC-type transport system involved in multi-copper enzyme maturation permease subunit